MLRGKIRYKWEHAIHFSGQIGRIVDLSFPKQKLFIEVDGGSHNSELAQAKDGWKDRLASEMGWRTLRFTVDQCLTDMSGVILSISRSLLEKGKMGTWGAQELRKIVDRLAKMEKWEAIVGEFLRANPAH